MSALSDSLSPVLTSQDRRHDCERNSIRTWRQRHCSLADLPAEQSSTCDDGGLELHRCLRDGHYPFGPVPRAIRGRQSISSNLAVIAALSNTSSGNSSSRL